MKSSGFTVIELMVVLSIIGVLLLIGIPNYFNYASDQRVVTTARTLAADLRLAQREAVAHRTPITVSFTVADTSCAAGSASYMALMRAQVLRRSCFPPDVRLAALSAARVTFEALGVTQDGMTMVVRSARTSKAVKLSVIAETGAVVDELP